MDLNKVMIIGNLTQKPELRTTPQGASVTSFGVATNFVWNDSSGVRQSKAEFHNVVAWRKLAEICCQYLSKGRRIFIEGRLQTRDWEDQNGVKRYRTEIVADNMIMLDRSGVPASPQMEAETSVIPSGTVAPQPQPTMPASSDVVEDEIKLEDIPF